MSLEGLHTTKTTQKKDIKQITACAQYEKKTTIYLAQRGQSFKPSASTDLGLREGDLLPRPGARWTFLAQ